MGKVNVIWEPQKGSQTRFLSCPYYEVLYEGTRGNGKTDSLLMDFAQHCGIGYGANWRGILFRQTYPQLADVVAKSKKWFYQIFPKARFNAADYKWVWPTGEELLLRHIKNGDDYWNYHGHEYPWIGFEELTNWASPDCYDMMKACSRSSHIGMPRKYRSNCNPYGVGHGWVKMRFIDPAPAQTPIIDNLGTRIRIHGDVEENARLLEADPEYISKLEAIDDENLRKAWRYGAWDIVAGGIFTEVWEPSKHVLSPFDIPKTWRIDRSFDWGSSRPFSVLWWAESDGSEVTLKDGGKRNFPRGTLFLINEWYGWTGKPNEGLKMLAADVAKGIKEREDGMSLTVRPGPADNSIFDTQDGHCIADNMAAHGVRWERSDKSPGSRTNGWELVRGRLAAGKKHPMEEPGLFAFEHCRQWLRTVPSLPRDDKKMDDVDSDSEDHCFAGDTQIITDRGIQCIVDMVGTSGQILTAEGIWADYKDCRLTRKSAETVEVFFSDGNSVKCTPDHLFMTGKGWLRALMLSDETCYSVYSISTGGLQWNHLKLAIQSKSLTALTITNAVRIFVEKASYCTGLFTKRIMGTFQKASMFTTRTQTDQITPLATLRYWINQSIRHCIPVAGQTTNFQSQPGLMPQSGIGRQKVKFGTANKPSKTTLLCRRNQCNVITVASGFKSGPPTGNSSNIALTIVDQPQEEQEELTMNKECVSFADRPSQLINIGQLRHAGGRAVPLGENKKAVKVIKGISSDVYCLSVPGYGAFALANGVMVKNCGDATRYRISMPKRTVTSHSAW